FAAGDHNLLGIFKRMKGVQNIVPRDVELTMAIKNPRNPYSYEISFDQHVWLPRANGKYVHVDGALRDRDAIQALIENTFPECRSVDPRHGQIVEERIIAPLSEADIRTLDRKLSELHVEANLGNRVRVATHFFPEFRDKMGTTHVNPPESIHRMQKGDP